MKIRSDIHAGAMTRLDQQCQAERDYWKAQANKMEAIAKGPGPNPPYYPPYNPPTPKPPVSGGGWVGGTYFPDRSGLCG